jgi:hypothetical protein
MQKLPLLIFLLSSTWVVPAKAEISRQASCIPRVPTIEYLQAVKIALKAAGFDENTKKVFVDEVNLLCEEQKQFWTIGLRMRELETGQIIIRVYMDGATEISGVKDG